MAAADLPQHLINAGWELLAALDDAGMQAQGGAWLFDHDLGDWRFVVATGLVDSLGRLWVYNQIVKVVCKLDMPKELTIADVHLIGLKNPMFKAMGHSIQVDRGLIRFDKCMINDMAFDGAIYRWGSIPTPIESKKIERDFVKRIRELSG